MAGKGIASVGECMIELSQGADNNLTRSYGGDTLNTAVYLARLGVSVDYVTALGDDPFSDEMLQGWIGEGVGIGQVMRVPGKLPGLYAIRTSEATTATMAVAKTNSPNAEPSVLTWAARPISGGPTRKPR